MQQWEPLVFEFRGTAKRAGRSNSHTTSASTPEEWGATAATECNERRLEIADSIRAELKRLLPPGTECFVEIEYFPGSVEWCGMVNVLQGTALLADNISLALFISQAIRLIVDRVNRRQLQQLDNRVRSSHSRLEVQTTVSQVGPAPSHQPTLGTSKTVDASLPSGMSALLYLNTALLLLISALLICKVF